MESTIRHYQSKDAEDISEFNLINSLAYRFNADFKSENIFCAEVGNQVVASGHLEPMESCEYLEREGKGDPYRGLKVSER